MWDCLDKSVVNSPSVIGNFIPSRNLIRLTSPLEASTLGFIVSLGASSTATINTFIG